MKNLLKVGFVSFLLICDSTLSVAQENSEESSTPEEQVVEKHFEEFVSDGSVINIPRSNDAKISPISGWKVRSSASVALMMEEPDPEKTDDISYQRNITLAVIQKPAYMNGSRLSSFLKELQNNYSKSTQNYTIADNKVFDLSTTQKAIMVYAAYTLNNIDLMQLNILVSDNSKQYLITYTDLASRFTNEEQFTKAWNSMTSIELQGTPSNPLYQYLSLALVILLVFVSYFVVRSLRRKSEQKLFEQEANSIYDDDDSDNDNFNFDDNDSVKDNNDSSSDNDDEIYSMNSNFNF